MTEHGDVSTTIHKLSIRVVIQRGYMGCCGSIHRALDEYVLEVAVSKMINYETVCAKGI